MRERRIRVGTYLLGSMRFTVWANNKHGGSFRIPDDGPAEMIIGVPGSWPDAVYTLLHEALEASMMELRLRYSAVPCFADDSGGFLFVATHELFSEAVARVAYFLVPVLPELAKAHKRLKK